MPKEFMNQTREMKRVHFVGVGGVGMGTFAVALSDQGYEVTGSDGTLYEPMKSVLATAKVKCFEGYVPETVTKVKPDIVVIGNVVRKDNPEVMAWLQTETPFVSFPEAVRRFLIADKNSIVCAGTHGKTTTTSWVAFLLKELGADPSYLIGGVPQDLPRGCVLTSSNHFVGEGDEYDSAFFDKGPKFLHYNPKTLILSSIEFDHADIYRDLDHVKSSFAKLVALMPGDGLCIARQEDTVVMDVMAGALCPVQTFGFSTSATWRIGAIEESEKGFDFEVIYKGRSAGNFRTQMFGEHNLCNLLSGIVCAVNLGYRMDTIRPIVERFHGARRRQEILMQSPYLLVDDFAHHPTEVKATLKAVRRRYPSGKLWALFEPRSATARRNVHQEDYGQAFESADTVLLSAPYRSQELQAEQRFSVDTLATDLKAKGKVAEVFSSPQEIVDFVSKKVEPGDRIVVMSNGEFGKIQEKLISALQK